MTGTGEVLQDYFPPELARLTSTAVAVLATHVTDRADRGGHCASCGREWPCEPAQLADHNLAGL